MTDSIHAAEIDRRPAVLICNWSASDVVWDLVEDLSGELWNPPGARSLLVEGGADPDALAAELSARLARHEARALLLLGRTLRPGPARLQIRAENRNGERQERLDAEGPGVVRPTAPAAAVIEAISAASRLTVVADSDAEEDAGSRILYRVLAALPDEAETPSVGLLRFPAETPQPGVCQAVKAALGAMTQRLTPGPRVSAPRPPAAF